MKILGFSFEMLGFSFDIPGISKICDNRNPYTWIVNVNPLLETQSNALDRPVSSAPNTFLLSTTVFHYLGIVVKDYVGHGNLYPH